MLPSRLLSKTRMVVTNTDMEYAKDLLSGSLAINNIITLSTKIDRRTEFRGKRLIEDTLKELVPNGSSYISNDLKSCSVWITPQLQYTNSRKMNAFMILRRSAGISGISTVLDYKKKVMMTPFNRPFNYLLMWGHSPGTSLEAAADTILSPMLKYSDEKRMHIYVESNNEMTYNLYQKLGFTQKIIFTHGEPSKVLHIMERKPI
jgi:hypothetical protein